MDLTLNIIMDHLAKYQILAEPEKRLRSQTFPWISHARYACALSLDEGWLHVVDAAEASAFFTRHEKGFAVCVCESADVPEGFEDFSNRSMLVYTGSDADALFVELRDYFVMLANWVKEMMEIYQEGGSYTDYLAASEPVIGNFISVTDSAFRLLGYTPNVESDDPLCKKLVKLGYHDPEIVEAFNSANMLEEWLRSSNYLEVYDKSPVCNYPTVGHVFKYRQSYYVHAVMVCNNRKLTDGLCDLFTMLIRQLELHVDRMWERRAGFSQPHDRLFAELLDDNHRLSLESMQDEARILGIPVTGCFQLCVIDLAEDDTIRREDLAWKLADQLSGFKVTVYREHILVLRVTSQAQAAHSALGTSFEFLTYSFLTNYVVRIGESNVFSRLDELDFAFDQAVIALEYGGCEKGTLYENYDVTVTESNGLNPCYRFRDCFVNYLLYSSQKDSRLLNYCISHHPFVLLCNDDKANKATSAELLLTYIACNCKATLTAQRLHMHRNNVIYHIEQMKSRYGIDLNDASMRFEIVLLSRLIKSAHANKTKAGELR